VPPPRWGKPPKRPAADVGDSLAVGLIWESGGRSGISESWSDSPPKRTKVESLLPTILWEIERRSDRADKRREQEKLAAIEREKLQAEAERRGRILHAENVRAEVLRDQHARWREGLQLRDYVAAMDRVIERLPGGADRAAAAEWRAWCQEYVTTVLDPLGQPLAMPAIREWTREEQNSLEKRIADSSSARAGERACRAVLTIYGTNALVWLSGRTGSAALPLVAMPVPPVVIVTTLSQLLSDTQRYQGTG
jgi:hypothetical protein